MQDDGPGGFGGYRMAVLAVAADIHDGHRTASADRSNGSGPATLAVPGPGGFGSPARAGRISGCVSLLPILY